MARIIEGPLALCKTEDGDLLPGRYSVVVDPDDVFANPDLHTDFWCEIRLAGQWIEGHIRHTRDGIYAIEYPKGAYWGYYFQATDGSRCGLCAGMFVRIDLETGKTICLDDAVALRPE